MQRRIREQLTQLEGERVKKELWQQFNWISEDLPELARRKREKEAKAESVQKLRGTEHWFHLRDGR